MGYMQVVNMQNIELRRCKYLIQKHELPNILHFLLFGTCTYVPCFTLPSTWHSIQYIVFKIIVWAFINGSWSWHRDFDREPVTSLHEAHKTLEGTCDLYGVNNPLRGTYVNTSMKFTNYPSRSWADSSCTLILHKVSRKSTCKHF